MRTARSGTRSPRRCASRRRAPSRSRRLCGPQPPACRSSPERSGRCASSRRVSRGRSCPSATCRSSRPGSSTCSTTRNTRRPPAPRLAASPRSSCRPLPQPGRCGHCGRVSRPPGELAMARRLHGAYGRSGHRGGTLHPAAWRRRDGGRPPSRVEAGARGDGPAPRRRRCGDARPESRRGGARARERIVRCPRGRGSDRGRRVGGGDCAALRHRARARAGGGDRHLRDGRRALAVAVDRRRVAACRGRPLAPARLRPGRAPPGRARHGERGRAAADGRGAPGRRARSRLRRRPNLRRGGAGAVRVARGLDRRGLRPGPAKRDGGPLPASSRARVAAGGSPDARGARRGDGRRERGRARGERRLPGGARPEAGGASRRGRTWIPGGDPCAVRPAAARLRGSHHRCRADGRPDHDRVDRRSSTRATRTCSVAGVGRPTAPWPRFRLPSAARPSVRSASASRRGASSTTTRARSCSRSPVSARRLSTASRQRVATTARLGSRR